MPPPCNNVLQKSTDGRFFRGCNGGDVKKVEQPIPTQCFFYQPYVSGCVGFLSLIISACNLSLLLDSSCVKKRYSTEVEPYVGKVAATKQKLQLIIARFRSKSFLPEILEKIQQRQSRELSGERKLEIV